MEQFNRFLFALSLALLLPLPASLYSQFTIDAELRPRFEVRNGYQSLAHEDWTPAVLISQRSRFTFSYRTDDLRLHFSPQDVRLWGGGAEGDLGGFYTNTLSALDIFEGYAEIRIGNNNWLSVGRQQLIYDNQWLLSGRNWNQASTASDALLFKIDREYWRLHIATSWNTIWESPNNNHYPTDGYKTLNFIWYNQKLSDEISFSLLHMITGRTEGRFINKIHLRNTSGTYLSYRGDNIFGHANLYYQYGKSQEGREVSAGLLAVEAGLVGSIVNPGLGLVVHTGNESTGDSKRRENLFDKVHSPRHATFGNMDYFTNLEIHTAEGGLVNTYLWASIPLSDNLAVKNTGHLFWLHKLNPSTPDKKYLGFENDLIVSWQFRKWANIEGGALFFSPTESLRDLQSVPDGRLSRFFYLQMTLKPELFRSGQ